MKRKYAAVVFLILLLLSLLACSEQNTGSEGSSVSGQASEAENYELFIIRPQYIIDGTSSYLTFLNLEYDTNKFEFGVSRPLSYKGSYREEKDFIVLSSEDGTEIRFRVIEDGAALKQEGECPEEVFKVVKPGFELQK